LHLNGWISRSVGRHNNSPESHSLSCLQGLAIGHDQVGLVILLVRQSDFVLDGLRAAGNIGLRFVSGVMMVADEKGDANSSSSRSANTNSNRLTGAVAS